MFYGCVSVAWEIGKRRPEKAQRGPGRPREAHRGPQKPREAHISQEKAGEGQRGPERPRGGDQEGPEKPREGQREQGRRSLCNVSVACLIVLVCVLIVSFSRCSLVVGSLWNVSVCFVMGVCRLLGRLAREGQRGPERPREAHRGP